MEYKVLYDIELLDSKCLKDMDRGNEDPSYRPESDVRDAGRFMHRPRGLIVVILVVVVIGFVLWLLVRRSADSAAPFPEVTVAVVDTARVDVYGEYEGNIRARQSVEVTARVEGVLEKMLFKEGSYVKKGQILFVIDPGLYQARADRAQAQLEKAKALKAKADRDLGRIRPLYEQKAASQLDLDNAEAAVECAEADVAICRVDLLEARVTLGYTRVTAPISGYISERMIDVGALVGPGGRSLLATIVRSDTVMIDFSMTSLEYLKSRDRDVNIRCDDGECLDRLPSYVTVIMADGSEYPYRGLVDFADPVADTGSGTFSVRAEMPNPDNRLLPGEKIRVKVLLDVLEGAMTVPEAAVRDDGDDAKYVYVVSGDGSVERRQISVGERVGKRIVVNGGIRPGEMVATDKFELLSDVVVVTPVVVAGKDNHNKAAVPSEDMR